MRKNFLIYWLWAIPTITGLFFGFINNDVSDILLTVSSIFFLILLYQYGKILKDITNGVVNLIPLFWTIVFLALFANIPLYLTNSYFTWLFAQFIVFFLSLLYLRKIIVEINSDKSILALLLLSIVTLGIYPFFFYYSLTKEISAFEEKRLSR
ncbi:DUF4234 domain-containing protein [Thermosipho ferrireducens]|uniref:DUF4234 domain-containing protein n=1 Tax=Thermosipho ferrireducens TaxID=2571116 RepID=A0ABX7S5U9_9BACT|nr:DUF4234 domain-containing protein [Thermosipho ferrireducens]QTA37946.1 DUF4234 domain-containing protein [Thermosipho ferrireducens]